MISKVSKLTDLNFDKFRRLATDDSLSSHEKIGFFDSVRKGKTGAILTDILTKLTNMKKGQQTVVDIGCGCGDLAFALIELCQRQGHEILLVDSQEMLSHLPDGTNIVKVAAKFPQESGALSSYSKAVDVILVYSVLHYVFKESDYLTFIDEAVKLLRPGGQLLLGDLPNLSMRNRFFASEAGIEFHQQNNQTKERPQLEQNRLEGSDIDDSIIATITARYRQAGLHSFCLPQGPDLPMANRREDVLITRP